MVTKIKKVFNLKYMIAGHVYLIKLRNESAQEAYGILKSITPAEAVFVTMYGDIHITPEEVEKDIDIKELKIEVESAQKT